MQTERPSPRYSAIDLWDSSDVVDAMLEGQFAAVAAVHAARLALERAALAIEERLRAGGRLVYAGAGTSGRLAVQDAMGRAQAMAAGAGRALGPILRVEEQRAFPQPKRDFVPMIAMRTAQPETPISAGESEVRAQVTVTVAIR